MEPSHSNDVATVEKVETRAFPPANGNTSSVSTDARGHSGTYSNSNYNRDDEDCNATPMGSATSATSSDCYLSPPKLQKRKWRTMRDDLTSEFRNDDDQHKNRKDKSEKVGEDTFCEQNIGDDGSTLSDGDKNGYEDSHTISILNLVVDHAMKPPSPLEPDEFQWMLQQQTRKQIGMNRRTTDDDAVDCNLELSQESNDKSTIATIPEEEEIKVPVIRVFGPVIRGEGLRVQDDTPDEDNSQEKNQLGGDDKSYSQRKPLQHPSGCLHIHGAYPYMLARPVNAGPDGSSYLFQACGNLTGDDDKDCTSDNETDHENGGALQCNVNIDWDCPDSVASIVDDIHYKLEMALRCSTHPSSQTEQDQKQAQVQKQERFIRQITVVNGRGFYTYCNGAIAPFLRVEYYNPSHRWRVKIVLERGFDMPIEQHPPKCASKIGTGVRTELRNRRKQCRDLNGVGAVQNNDTIDDGLDVMTFRCYEAHLPYTMQFFKDWNLAGMSWIRVGDGRFRMSYSQIAKEKKNEKDRNNLHELLQEDIPKNLQWIKNLDDVQGWQNKHETPTSDPNGDIIIDQFWTKKETSCAIEIDTTVNNILNVQDVMTQIPKNEMGEKEEGIHWRAVPSLREIWMEERKRMAYLLPPKDNFLSSEMSPQNENNGHVRTEDEDINDDERKHKGALEKSPSRRNNHPVPFTLSVKKGAPLPGSRLALQGVKHLFDSSPTLEADFRKALKDILIRYDDILDDIDRKLHLFYSRYKQDDGEGEESQSSISAKGKYCGTKPNRDGDASFTALDALLEKFQTYSSPRCSQDSNQNNGHPPMLNQGITSPPPNVNLLSQNSSLYPPPLLTQADLQEVEQDLEFCIKQERDTLYNESEDELDTSMLTTYDDCKEFDDYLQEEENMEEDEFERFLMTLATQDYDYKSISSRRDAKISDVHHSKTNLSTYSSKSRIRHPLGDEGKRSINDEIKIGSASHQVLNVENRGKYHSEWKAVTSPKIGPTSRRLSYDDTETSRSCRGKAASSSREREDKEIEVRIGSASSRETAAGVEDIVNVHYTPSVNQTLLGQESITPVEQSESLPSIGTNESEKYCAENMSKIQLSLSSNSASSIEGSGNMIGLIFSPPIRRLCDPNTHQDSNESGDNILWHPIAYQQDQAVSWLGFSHTYNIKKEITFHLGQGFLEPVQRPPSFRRVRRWMIKKRNRAQIEYHIHEKEKATRGKIIGGKKSVTAQEFEKKLDFDENTRKLKMQPVKKRRKRVAFADSVQISTCTMHEVEEVRYQDASQDLSQGSEYSLSQDLQSDHRTKKKKKIHKLMDSAKNLTAPEISQTTAQTNESDDGPSQQTKPLDGIGQQGGKLYVEGPVGLKTSSIVQKSSKSHPPSEVTIMSIEVHVQTRTGKASTSESSREISMKPDPTRDAAFAVCYVYAIDPGGGEKICVKERGCIFVPTQNELNSHHGDCKDQPVAPSKIASKIGKTMGCSSELKIEAVGSERNLLLRIAAVVQYRDPDALISWDTQNAGLGYLIERGLALGDKEISNLHSTCIDMVRLLGRCPSKHGIISPYTGMRLDEKEQINESKTEDSKRKFDGSILGAEWDDRVGAGAGPSSIVGRLILNCWKIMSDEVKHPNASYQPAMVATVLNKRIPFHDDLLLSRWYGRNKGAQRWRVLKYRILQAQANILLFDALDVIGRAGEAARLSGVELSQSFPGIRGSQYKVEGVLLRALQSLWSDERGEKKGKQQSLSAGSDLQASLSQSPWKLHRNLAGLKKPMSSTSNRKHSGYFFFSPSKADCGNQEALECQAMTLEPKSGFHFDPIVVCDFTALYPSLVIAYNLCYSTCAGKLEYHSTRSEMRRQGQTTQKLGPFRYDELHTASVLKQHMKSLRDEGSEKSRNSDRAYCLPTGSLFVSEDVLKGVLPSVLDEILATRAMLKKAAKEYKRVLPKPPVPVLRQLEARQLALKYVANVTYGYTSATFSGRSAMPLLADAIVETGRRTLTNAIMLATKWGMEEKGHWKGAEVVYGDTDSIFIKLPGRSVKEAFAFGKEFCKAVTASNPPPIQLKLEKVYLGTLLQTKKKYCGMKYDSPDQKVPTFEAKGIETIRKDQCALTQKILQNALISIFKGSDINSLREYLVRQWSLINSGHLPVSDFILTGRVRSQYRGKVGPVQAALARRLTEADPGRKILHKERLPYVIVAAPGRSFKLRDCVLTPNELLAQWDSFTIHSEYYATKHVNAALNRCFSLAPFKIDIHSWYETAPKPRKRIHYWPVARSGNNSMISAYFGSDICTLCGQKSKSDGSGKSVICNDCRRDKNAAAFLALQSLNDVQQKAHRLAMTCRSCNGCVESAGTYAIEKVKLCQKKTPISRNGVGHLCPSSPAQMYSTGVTSPLSTCTCIDCPVTYKRHEMRESEIEALALCNALQLFIKFS